MHLQKIKVKGQFAQKIEWKQMDGWKDRYNCVTFLANVVSKQKKCELCVICSYPQHEEEVGELARELGFTHISLSSAIMPMARIVPRGFTGLIQLSQCDI